MSLPPCATEKCPCLDEDEPDRCFPEFCRKCEAYWIEFDRRSSESVKRQLT